MNKTNELSKVSTFSEGLLNTLPDSYIDNLDGLSNVVHFIKSKGAKWDVSVKKNSRWNVLLNIFMEKNPDGNEVESFYHIWTKCSTLKAPSKRQRQITLQSLAQLGIIEKLTQEDLGKMLSVTTSTISKDLRDLP